jgi:hypothetical protein
MNAVVNPEKLSHIEGTANFGAWLEGS